MTSATIGSTSSSSSAGSRIPTPSASRSCWRHPAVVRPSKSAVRKERDFQDLKQEIGLDHYEGRGWRGFHHHAALSIAAYGFLVAERSPIPPQAPSSGPSRSSSRRQAKPIVHAEPPLRPERHTPNSITTIRHRIAVVLARQLPRCPCCLRQIKRSHLDSF
jgi:hypothetical protein